MQNQEKLIEINHTIQTAKDYVELGKSEKKFIPLCLHMLDTINKYYYDFLNDEESYRDYETAITKAITVICYGIVLAYHSYDAAYNSRDDTMHYIVYPQYETLISNFRTPFDKYMEIGLENTIKNNYKADKKRYFIAGIKEDEERERIEEKKKQEEINKEKHNKIIDYQFKKEDLDKEINKLQTKKTQGILTCAVLVPAFSGFLYISYLISKNLILLIITHIFTIIFLIIGIVTIRVNSKKIKEKLHEQHILDIKIRKLEEELKYDGIRTIQTIKSF